MDSLCWGVLLFISSWKVWDKSSCPVSYTHLDDMRNKFDEQLDNLNNELIKMGKLCEQAISGAIKITMEDDHEELKREVLETDSEIDKKERDIESICMKLLLRQQPVARDLRVISSALKMISDMERIGDQASDIVELAQYIKKSDVKYKTHLSLSLIHI